MRCLEWIHLGVAYPSCHFFRTACFLEFIPTLSYQSQFLSLQINPFPLLVGTFSPALGKGPRTMIFSHKLPPSICLTQLPGLRAGLLWCSVLVIVSSPLPAFTALYLDPNLASPGFWHGHQLGPLKVKPFPQVSLFIICLGTECDSCVLSAEVLHYWRGPLFSPSCSSCLIELGMWLISAQWMLVKIF